MTICSSPKGSKKKGNELFRHEGFYSKRDILGKWKELGVGDKEEE